MFRLFLAALALELFSFLAGNTTYAVNDVPPPERTFEYSWEDPSDPNYAPYNPEGSGSLYDAVGGENAGTASAETSCIAAGATLAECGISGSGGSGGGGGGGQSAAAAAQAQSAADLAALNAFVMPTLSNHFSLSNVNSDNEASLYIGNDNGENNIVFRIIRLIAMLVGTVAILLYIIAGYFMIFSQGDENQLTKGKQIVGYTSLGLVLVFTAYMIVQLVLGLMYFAG